MSLNPYRLAFVVFITGFNLPATANEWFIGINTGVEQNKVSISRNKNPPAPSNQTIPAMARVFQSNNGLLLKTLPARTVSIENQLFPLSTLTGSKLALN